MKLFIFLNIFCLLKVFLDCSQTLYKFDPEHCEITNVNDSLVHYYVKKCFKLSRWDLRLNSSLYYKQDILNDHMGQVLITGYMFRSNEYRKGPIEFMLGLCSAMNSKDYDIPNMFANSNYRCPFIKGQTYYAYNLAPNAANMPPFLPAGRWMFQFDYMYLNRYVIASIKWYTTIEYPIHIPSK